MCRIRLKSGLSLYSTGGGHLGNAAMGLCNMVPKVYVVLKLSHRPDNCSDHYPAVSTSTYARNT